MRSFFWEKSLTRLKINKDEKNNPFLIAFILLVLIIAIACNDENTDTTFEGKCLVVNLSYSGGCEKHVVDLARLHPSCGTPPLPPPTFEIRHDSKNDPCEAWVTETYRFDMVALADEFDGSVKIILQAVESEDSFYSKELMINFD